MKYFVILLILIGFFSSANAIQYQSPETDKPVYLENSIHVIPEILWDIHEVILDGTIVEYDNNTWTYHIKINQVFKGSLNSDLISAEGFDVWNYFKKGDSALFYLYDISPVSANYKYKITDYSVKTSPVCDARSLIQISPILPNDPNRIVRGHPNIPANWKDPCVPDYFSYDPDFFNFREVIAPLKQLKHKIPIDKIRCYDDKVLLFRNSNGSPVCVKSESLEKLRERGWAEPLGDIVFQRPSQSKSESDDTLSESDYDPHSPRCGSGVIPYIPENWQTTGMHPSGETWETLNRHLMVQFFFKELQNRNIVFEPACFGVYTGIVEQSYPPKFSMCSMVTASNGTDIYLEGTIREFDVTYFDIDNEIPYQCDDNQGSCLCGIENEN